VLIDNLRQEHSAVAEHLRRDHSSALAEKDRQLQSLALEASRLREESQHIRIAVRTEVENELKTRMHMQEQELKSQLSHAQHELRDLQRKYDDKVRDFDREREYTCRERETRAQSDTEHRYRREIDEIKAKYEQKLRERDIAENDRFRAVEKADRENMEEWQRKYRHKEKELLCITNKLKLEHAAQMTTVQEQHQRALQKLTDDAKTALHAHTQELAGKDRAIASLQAKVAEGKRESERGVSDVMSKHSDMARLWAAKKNEYKKAYEDKLQECRSKFEQKLKSNCDRYEDAMELLKKKYDSVVQNLKRGHQQEVFALKQSTLSVQSKESSAIDALHHDISARDTKISQLAKKISALETARVKECTALRSCRDELSLRVQELRAMEAELESTHELGRRAESHMEKLHDHLAVVEHEKTDLFNKLSACERVREAAERGMEEMEAEVQRVNAETQHQRDVMAELQWRVRELELEAQNRDVVKDGEYEREQLLKDREYERLLAEKTGSLDKELDSHKKLIERLQKKLLIALDSRPTSDQPPTGKTVKSDFPEFQVKSVLSGQASHIRDEGLSPFDISLNTIISGQNTAKESALVLMKANDSALAAIRALEAAATQLDV
jgi:hypothetical protein